MLAKTEKSVHDRNSEKQMSGCMAGFFNLFDRNHLLSAKRLYPKRLPPPVKEAATESISIVESPALLKDTEKLKPPPQEQPEKDVAAVTPPPHAAATWKFTRETPRLSLDSRAITDAKGGLRPREIRVKTAATAADDEETEYQRRSPSVIARLMGLGPLPSSTSLSGSSEVVDEPDKIVQLRRSTSESRSRDYYKFADAPSFLSPVGRDAGERKLDQSVAVHVDGRRQTVSSNSTRKNNDNNNNKNTKTRNQNSNSNQRKPTVERKCYYDTADFFPPEVAVKQQHQSVTVYGEIERRLRMKGIDEPSKDLETLKHILEALQLKGLLHSSTTSVAPATKCRKNVVHNRRFLLREEESPIVLMKSTRSTSPSSTTRQRQRNVASGEPLVSPRRERMAKSPARGENQSTSPILRRKSERLSVETQRKGNETPVIQSPRMSRRSEQTASTSPRTRKSTVEIECRNRVLRSRILAEDETSTVSGSSLSTSSYTDNNEKWRTEDYRDGRNLLKRCDKLLNSIAEITTNSSLNSNSNSNSNSTELQQPSPVSVLDSSFYKEDESSPSPVKKRTIEFKDEAVTELEDELWSPSSSSTQLLKFDNDIDSLDDSEFSYVLEVLRASKYFPDDSNLFMLLEKRNSIRGSRRHNSKVSVLQRKLIFDTIIEILDRNTQLPPWKVASIPETRPMSDQIWSEFQKIREQGPSEDLLEVICGVLKKDMAEDSTTGWVGFPMEMSEAVLDIERSIFKDLIGEIIRDLASVAEKNMRLLQAPRRKLVF
ncbi:hypothetical protein vseg_016977 [Gypsophila vaccaria]